MSLSRITPPSQPRHTWRTPPSSSRRPRDFLEPGALSGQAPQSNRRTSWASTLPEPFRKTRHQPVQLPAAAQRSQKVARPVTQRARPVPKSVGTSVAPWARTVTGNSQRRRQHGAPPVTTIADLPDEILEQIFKILDTWSLGSVAQVCCRWNLLLQWGGPSLWKHTVLAVRNPVFVTALGGVIHSSYRHKFGAEVLNQSARMMVKARKITQIKLIGPNIHHEPWHLAQLAVEVPNLAHLILHKCQLSAATIDAIANDMPHLSAVTIEQGWSMSALAELSRIPNLSSLSLVKLSNLNDRGLSLLLRNASKLTELTLVNCDRVTKSGIAQLRNERRFAKIKFTVYFDDSAGELPRSYTGAAAGKLAAVERADVLWQLPRSESTVAWESFDDLQDPQPWS